MTVGLAPAEGRMAMAWSRAGRATGGLFLCALLLALATLLGDVTPAAAQALPGIPQNLSAPQDPNKKMLVTADELVYDYEKNTVGASGNVQLYYDGASLEARRVTYDRNRNLVTAEGNVRLKQKDGTIVNAENLQLSDDFKEGFISSLRIDTTEKTHFAATRADRVEGNITVLQNGVYTACEPCKEHPERPVLWQVKAARIIHNQNEQMIYYKDATLEFFGLPIAYFPYFSSPDPTVKRKTGFLAPIFANSSQLGFGFGVPFFWNIAPDRDLTLSPVYYTQQGLLMQGEWRQRLMNGSYDIRAAGIIQNDKEEFAGLPGYRDNRGVVQSKGEFVLSEQWKWGWDGTLASDRTFINDYSLGNYVDGLGLLTTVPTEVISQIYLTGQGDRSFFDLRGLYFLGLSVTDNQEQIPIVGTFNYNYIFGNPLWGGEAGVKVNFNAVSRNEADFVGTSAANSFPSGGIGIAPGACAITNPNPTQCLLRGAPGEYQRLSAELYWKKSITDQAGQIWTPFASARVDVAHSNISALPTNYTGGFTLPGQNPLQAGQEDLIRAMPVIGLDYRYPFISVQSWGTQTIEPRAQLVIRPNETGIGRLPNEDAQSLVFDDTTLFEVDKYSGYDRVEGGGRLNVGITYTAALNNAGLVTAVIGQSYHLFGLNSFSEGDMANTGLESGLETNVSDYVARFSYSPTNNLEFVSRFRFDEQNFSLQRFELEGRAAYDRISVAAVYGLYSPQPLLGYYEEREGIYTTASYRLTNEWSVAGGLRYNIAQSGFDMTTVGVTYADDCFTMALSYVSNYSLNGPYQTEPNSTVLLTIGLRTLGQTALSTSLGSSGTTGTSN
ncbi:LPS-assembly protein LptD [Aquabacter spiritensis]|uniref:LPS-assembly protein LptD n=1 Tax=Aquabacter spiritensis TaxID=933073 RepID=A0A4R3LYZ7_9HYPH|nr:LPS-assembly protein LptD [Aquabacter spiritensis]TCT05089.1 LPS-assembly protein [Aquabacter spiritensis]